MIVCSVAGRTDMANWSASLATRIALDGKTLFPQSE
jgi:hypothetical protein